MADERRGSRHRGKMRGDRFTDDEWEALAPVATHFGVSRPQLLRDYVLYLIGERDELRSRPD